MGVGSVNMAFGFSALLMFLFVSLIQPVHSSGEYRIPVYQRDATLFPRNTPLHLENTRWKYRSWTTRNDISMRKMLQRRGAVNMEVKAYDTDIEYFTKVQIGTPPREFKVILDTGSSDFLVPSVTCKTCSGTMRYDPSASATYTFDGRAFIQHFHEGSQATGHLAADDVLLSHSPPIRVRNQTFGLIEKESAQFDDIAEGILGLAFDGMATVDGWKGPLTMMIEQGIITRAVFSVQLRNGEGELVLGDVKEKNKGLVYSPLTSEQLWRIKIGKVRAHSHTIHPGIHAAFDTGTTLLLVPPIIAQRIHARIPGAKLLIQKANDLGAASGTWALPCNVAEMVGESGRNWLEFEIAGRNLGLPLADLVREPMPNGVMGTGVKYCASAVQNIELAFIILGSVFMKRHYVVFDRDAHRIGIAPS
ncbi:uncharacterized protein VTP21DRAFT_5070 [Calcarisporiella thermophila]|uniref:uncharacterized protein n=1 Tax=Calcarisporiella thermophila TaxID=911321 RepID=UPI003743FC81